jgi:hypothetical protein
MSEITPQFEPRKGRPPKYPWSLWCDGKSRKLYRGSEAQVQSGEYDFNADLISFRTMVHRKARDLGPHIGAYTHINKADQSIQVRFYDRQKQ